MPLAARWLALKEMLSTPGAARPKFRRRIAPHANANAHSLRLDVQSLRQAAGISKSVADGDVFRSVLSDYDAVLSRLSRSSRNAMVLESLIVSGYDAMAVVHCQSRAPAIRKRALIDETKRLCAALERLSQPGTGYSAWLERCIEDNLRSLYPNRSYSSIPIRPSAGFQKVSARRFRYRQNFAFGDRGCFAFRLPSEKRQL
jgi:hypothetical protein